MIRRALFVLSVALLLTLTGCGGSTKEESQANASDEQAPSEVIIYDQSSQEPAVATVTDTSSFAGMLAAGEVSSIRVIGDSQTAGYLLDGFDGASDTGVIVYEGAEGTYWETPTTVRSWTNLFREYAASRGVQGFVNAGVSGFRMQYLAEDPDAWIREGADVIVVMLGTNDAAKESVEEFRDYTEQALSACAERCERLVVVSPCNNERTDAVNLYGMDLIDQTLTEVSSEHGWEHVSLLDVLQVGSSDFFDDQVHPTEEGSKKLWEAFRDRLGL